MSELKLDLFPGMFAVLFSKNQKKTKDLKEALEMTQKEKKVGEKDKKNHCSFSTLKMDSKAVPN